MLAKALNENLFNQDTKSEEEKCIYLGKVEYGVWTPEGTGRNGALAGDPHESCPLLTVKKQAKNNYISLTAQGQDCINDTCACVDTLCS